MTIVQIILLVCWGIFLFYWFVNWGNTKPTLEKFSSNSLRLIALGVILVIVLNRLVFHNALSLSNCVWGLSGCHYSTYSSLSNSFFVQVLSVICAIAGLSIAIVARRTLAGNWSSTLDLKKGHELVTTGIYSYVRHPIYSGVLLMLLGTLFAFVSATELVMITVVIVSFLLRIKKEEELMTKTFPKEYPDYKKRTKALIPFVW